MPCCEPQGHEDEMELVNGECSDCGEPTVDGEAVDICGYAPEPDCETCGSAHCTGYC